MKIKVRALKNFWGRSFVVFALFLGTAPLTLTIDIIKGEKSALGEGEPITRALWYGVYLITLFLILRRPKKYIFIAFQDLTLLLLTGLAVASIAWSTSASLSLRRIGALVGTTLLGVYIAGRFDAKEQLHLLAWALGIAAVLSLIFVVILPQYGLAKGKYFGAWQGIYNQKGGLGRCMSLSALVFFILTRTVKRRRWIVWMFFALSTILFLFSRSITSWLAFFAIVVCVPLYRILRRRWHYLLTVPFIISLVLIAVVLGVVIYLNRVPLLALFNKNPTVSGRLDLWPILWGLLKKRLWLGYGYSGFWVSGSKQVQTIWQFNPWLPREAHNSFLEIALQLGVLGAFLLALNLSLFLFRAIKWFRQRKTALDVWPLVYLTFISLISLTGNALLERNELFWVIYIIADLTVRVSLRRSRESQRPPSVMTSGEARETLSTL
jgi:exopolysaccharide production protein ExoQ